MSGLHKVVKGQLLENLIAPFLMIGGVLGGYLLFDDRLGPEIIIAIYTAVAAITSAAGISQLNQNFPQKLRTVKASYKTWFWVQKSLPFMILGAVYTLNSQTDIIMLGALSGSKSVGMYVVASKLASLILFILMASNMALGPIIANLYASDNIAEIKKVIRKTSRLILLVSCSIAVVLLVFKDIFLGLFGEEFLASGNVLTILIVGQLVSTFTGPASTLFDMSGHEKMSLTIFSLSAAVNVALNLYLIPQFDAEGAALATVISMALWSVGSLAFAIKYLGINPTAFSRNH
jgi:O-antigen/teichoic acid export membrane protein